MNSGDVTLENIACSNVTTCIHRTASATGEVSIRGVESGGTNMIVDDVFPVTYTIASYGTQMNDMVLGSGLTPRFPQILNRWEMIGIPDTPSPLGGTGKLGCYFSSTTNTEKCGYNGATPDSVVLRNTTDTLTNKTLSAGTVYNVGLLNAAGTQQTGWHLVRDTATLIWRVVR